MNQTYLQISITKGSIAEAVAVSQQIPEFTYAPLTVAAETALFTKRLHNKPHLILIARVNGEAVGFKVGYERYNKYTFYSFMGGVLPQYRRMGIAKALANAQEAWVKEAGYRRIVFKTRNRFANMLLFGISSGFALVRVKPIGKSPADYHIHLQKNLT